jgi:predicted nuclease with TOPRIM domain
MILGVFFTSSNVEAARDKYDCKFGKHANTFSKMQKAYNCLAKKANALIELREETVADYNSLVDEYRDVEYKYNSMVDRVEFILRKYSDLQELSKAVVKDSDDFERQHWISIGILNEEILLQKSIVDNTKKELEQCEVKL